MEDEKVSENCQPPLCLRSQALPTLHSSIYLIPAVKYQGILDHGRNMYMSSRCTTIDAIDKLPRTPLRPTAAPPSHAKSPLWVCVDRSVRREGKVGYEVGC